MPQAPVSEPPTKRRKTAADDVPIAKVASAPGVSIAIPTASKELLPSPPRTRTTEVTPALAKRACAATTSQVEQKSNKKLQGPKKVIASLHDPTSAGPHEDCVTESGREFGAAASAQHVTQKPAVKRTVKSRKTTNAEAKSSKQSAAAAEDVDDSFIAGLKTKNKPERQKQVERDGTAPQEPAAPTQEHPLAPAPEPAVKCKKATTRRKKLDHVAEARAVERLAESNAELRSAEDDYPREELDYSVEAHHVAAAASVPCARKANPRSSGKSMDAENTATLVQASEPAASRPKRQAAKSAMERVAQGFVEETGSVDKLRRAPKPTKLAARGRKRNAIPVDEVAETECIAPARSTSAGKPDIDLGFAPKRKGRKKAEAHAAEPMTTEPEHNASAAVHVPALDISAPPAQLPGKRKREGAEDEDGADELTAAAEWPKAKRSRKAAPSAKSKTSSRSRQKAVVSAPSPPGGMVDMAGLDGINEGAGPAPNKRGQKHAASTTEGIPVGNEASRPNSRLDTIEEVLELQHSRTVRDDAVPDDHAHQPTKRSDTAAPTAVKSRKKSSKQQSAVDETLLLFTPKKRRALAETDANRFSLSPGKAHQGNDEKALKKHKKTAQPELQPTGPKGMEEPMKSKSRSKEDIDWLFCASPQRKMPPKPQRKQKAQDGEKRTRLRFADRAFKDMDLDDLLESVAAF